MIALSRLRGGLNPTLSYFALAPPRSAVLPSSLARVSLARVCLAAWARRLSPTARRPGVRRSKSKSMPRDASRCLLCSGCVVPWYRLTRCVSGCLSQRCRRAEPIRADRRQAQARGARTICQGARSANGTSSKPGTQAGGLLGCSRPRSLLLMLLLTHARTFAWLLGCLAAAREHARCRTESTRQEECVCRSSHR